MFSVGQTHSPAELQLIFDRDFPTRRSRQPRAASSACDRARFEALATRICRRRQLHLEQQPPGGAFRCHASSSSALATALRAAAAAVATVTTQLCEPPRRLQLRRLLLLACEERGCAAAAPAAWRHLLARMRTADAVVGAPAASPSPPPPLTVLVHISKCGGTSLCAAALAQGLRTPPPRPKRTRSCPPNCSSTGAGSTGAARSSSRTRGGGGGSATAATTPTLSPDCNAERGPEGPPHLSPMWFGNPWNRWQPPVPCAALREYAARHGVQLLGNERYWDHDAQGLCGGGVRHIVSLREPVARASSQLRHLRRNNWRAMARHLRPPAESLAIVLSLEQQQHGTNMTRAVTSTVTGATVTHGLHGSERRGRGSQRRPRPMAPLASALLAAGPAAAEAAAADWTWRTFPWTMLPGLLSDYAVRVLAGSSLCAERTATSTASRERCHPFEMSAAEVRAAGGLQRAKAMLEQYDAVLILEEAARWPRLLAASLNWSDAVPVPHLRRSSSSSSIAARPGAVATADAGPPPGAAAAPTADDEHALLMLHNRLDTELYEYARRIERVDMEYHKL